MLGESATPRPPAPMVSSSHFLSQNSFCCLMHTVPDDVVIAVVKKQVTACEKACKSWVIEGFPRTKVQALALEQLGVIPDTHRAAVIRTLLDDLAAHDYHLNVGIVGAKFLLPTLVEAGRGDIALMVSQQPRNGNGSGGGGAPATGVACS